jgi:hypothetical protein
MSIAVSGSTNILECRIRRLLLSIPNVHSTRRLAFESRQLKILCSPLVFLDGYGRMKCSFNPNASSPTHTNGKDGYVVRGSGLSEGKSSCCWSNLLPKFVFFNIFESPSRSYAPTSMAVKQ